MTRAPAFDRIIDALRNAGQNVVVNGSNRAMAQCPAHDDRNPSLSITRTEGRTLMHCHGGCDVVDVLAALNFTTADLFDEPFTNRKWGTVYAEYRYPHGRKVWRTADKQFPQPGNNKDRSLYHADRIGDATTIYVVEGEEDVHAVEAAGGVAVCSAMGAGKAHLADWSPLAGRHVVIVADNDQPNPKTGKQLGREHALSVAALLDSAASVNFVEAAVGKDASDHIAAGKTLEELVTVDWWPPVSETTEDDRGSDAAGWLSDTKVSQRLVKRVLRNRYRWTKALGWMGWDGKRWVRTSHEDVVEQSRLFAAEMLVNAIANGVSGDRLHAYVRRLSASAVRAAADLAKGQLLIDAAEFDTHPDLLNVANGVVNLRTGAIGRHDSGLLLTKCAPTEYRRGATHPDWATAVAALPDDVAGWMQLRFGQAATGHPTPDDILPVLHGRGSNGKTTITTGINRTLGEGEYAVTVPDRVLLANPGDHPTELMTLRGARFALLEETPEARHLNVKRVKDSLGTTTMTARYIRQDSVTWAPTHSLFVTSNYRPRVEETDHGTWRRLALIAFPFTYRNNGEQLKASNDRAGDATLRQRVEAGLNGQHEAVLAWLVEGARRWYAGGQVLPQPPPTVVEATRKWRHDSDLILRWFDDTLIADSQYFIPGNDLYETFTAWLTANGHQKWTSQTFGDRFGQHDEITGLKIVHTRIWSRGTDLKASRSSLAFKPLPERFRAWFGVRYRTDADDRKEYDDHGKQDLWTAWTDDSGERAYVGLTRGNPEQPSRLSTDGLTGPKTPAAASPAGHDYGDDPVPNIDPRPSTSTRPPDGPRDRRSGPPPANNGQRVAP
jgi:putative DNA primase/helicase